VVVEGQTTPHHAVLKDFQRHPIRGTITHVDFHEVRLDRPIQATVAVHLVGESPGSKQGGIVQQVTREIQVEALPTGIPEHIEADISSLEVGGTVRIEDLPSLEGVTYLDDPQVVLANCSIPRGITELEEAEAAAAAEGEEGEEDAQRARPPRSRRRVRLRVGRAPLPQGRGRTSMDLLVAGLGNPGREHVRDRHNVGWMVVDELARRHGALSRASSAGRLADVRLAEMKLALLEPETYMNESGASIQSAAAFFKLPAGQVVVVHDDVDLETGRLQARLGGGLAGHNGLRSIAQRLGTQEFLRMRVGVGRPGRGDPRPVADYVLSAFAPEDDVAAIVSRAADAVETLASEGSRRRSAASTERSCHKGGAHSVRSRHPSVTHSPIA
jgi:PTH1 family peptidyl-tRNA hydrolase